MKKVLSIILCVLLSAALFAGCSGAKDDTKSADDTTTAAADTNVPTTKAAANTADPNAKGDMPTVLNTTEYMLYQNIFYNKQTADYAGQEAKKEGTFTTIQDEFNGTTRYYVWGYNDNTKCCDWQWELKIDDTSKLPSNGSLIEVTGTYEENDKALDGFWIINPEITVKQEYKADKKYDLEMLTMDNTLERVQFINVIQKKEAFEGKTVCCYGRVLDDKTLQDAYYDNSWTIEFSGDFELPAFGTTVVVYGTVQNGTLVNCTLGENTQY